jgi:protein O-GlcNAc transferase
MNRRPRLAARKQIGPVQGALPAIQEVAALAVQHHAAGRLSDAEDCYRRLLVLKPDFPEVYYNLGIALGAQGRLDEAAACYRKALVLKPAFPDAHNNLGNTLTAQGRMDDAAGCYRLALSLDPCSAEAHNGLGNTLREQGRLDEAIACLHKAIYLRPAYAEAHTNLGSTLREQGRPDEAIAQFCKAIDLRSDLLEAHTNLGDALAEQGRLAEAVVCCRRAIDLRSDVPEAHNHLGVAFHLQGQLDEAVACYRRVIELKPDHLMAHNNLGDALRAQGRLDEAIACFRRAVELRPDNAEALSYLIFLRKKVCDWQDFQNDEIRLADLVSRREKGVAPFMAMLAEIPLSGQLSCARTRIDTKTKSINPLFQHRPPQRSRKLRVGYLSADFQRHATAYLTAELFERHDRSQLNISGYSIGLDDGSDMRNRLAAGFDRFTDIRDLSHAQAAARIHEDEIDILVDLKGFTEFSRPQILAYRPAPIQVNYLGYPGTMGASFIDYILADAVVAPFEDQPFYSERIVHLPDCYQPNDAKRVIADPAPPRRDCGLPDQGFVFCCFNASYKITPHFFEIWMRLLRSVPDSVLWLLDGNISSRVNLRREAEAHGVAPERLVFAAALPLAEHLARHRQADLFLDTLPCNAHTTASDALWAGLPVLTCAGQTFAGRVASSLLRAIGLPELITASLEEYEALALKLAAEPRQLAALKDKLARNRLTMPLFDIARFTPRIEAAYLRMWEIWCTGQSPSAFVVGGDALSAVLA